MSDRIDEVLRRLEAIEQRLCALEGRGPTPPPPPAPHGCRLATDERRIVDLLVDLTSERIEERVRAIVREQERRRDDRPRDRRD